MAHDGLAVIGIPEMQDFQPKILFGSIPTDDPGGIASHALHYLLHSMSLEWNARATIGPCCMKGGSFQVVEDVTANQ